MNILNKKKKKEQKEARKEERKKINMQGRTENKEEIRDGIKVERNLMKVNAIDKKTNNQKKQMKE